MIRTFVIFACVLACAGAQAATINTTLTVTNATGALGASISVSGPATLTNIGSGTFTATLDIATLKAQYTIALSGGGGTITGALTLNANLLTGNGTASATVTGGTGPYAGATGSFPSLTGTGSVGTSITVSFTGDGTIFTGGSGGPPIPTVSAVLDSASNTPDVAQGGIFIVKGSNLCPSGTTFFNIPRPTVSPDGVKITFTPASGGAGTDSILVYEFNPSGTCQLAAILPSTVAVGNYNVTVTNGTASAPVSVRVLQRKLSLFTQDSSGSGLASVQNFISQGVVDLNRLTTGTVAGTTISPAKPGQFLLAYGTGLGPLVGQDNTAAPSFDFSTNGVNVKAIVGGVTLPVAYAGRAGFAGEDQINLQLPANIPTGCTVPFQISVDGVLSNVTYIAIAPDPPSTACVQPGFTTQQLQSLDQGNSIVTGGFSITQFGITIPQIGAVKSNAIAGGFVQLTGFQLTSAAQVNASVIQSGSCQVIQSTNSGSTPVAGGNLTYLDAGTVSVTGPAGSSLTSQVLTKTNNSYAISSTEGFAIPGQLNFLLPAGNYSLSGGGGADVGSFSTSLTLSSPLTVTGGLPSSAPRSSPLTLNWTGGNATDLVEIVGISSATTGTVPNQITTSTTFICLTTAGQKTFTVPSSVLTQLAASSANSPGLLEVASGNANVTFTAPLPKLGGSAAGVFSNFVGTGSQITWQ
jgi:uncharacterized protein (TIGR03437 family)